MAVHRRNPCQRASIHLVVLRFMYRFIRNDVTMQTYSVDIEAEETMSISQAPVDKVRKYLPVKPLKKAYLYWFLRPCRGDSGK